MEEKIKIHLHPNVYETLMKDCEAFEFFKGNTLELNKNAFLTALINHFYLKYQEKEDQLFSLLKKHFPDLKEDEIYAVVQDLNRY